MNAHQRKVARDQRSFIEAGRVAKEREARDAATIAQLERDLAAAETGVDEALVVIERMEGEATDLQRRLAELVPLNEGVSARAAAAETDLARMQATEGELREMVATAERAALRATHEADERVARACQPLRERIAQLEAEERDAAKLRRRLREREVELEHAQRTANRLRAALLQAKHDEGVTVSGVIRERAR